ncbi:MAG: diacylglycerol kinase family lipid kinase [Ignavibacteriales bacterium]|nr:diacylglycerol kinase family lipid kinase [Ignavibacteriales bacterium]
MKFLAIHNPKSRLGSNEQILNTLADKFGQSLSVVPTTYPSHATEIAKSATLKDVETIIAVGGDGTVNEVVNGIVGTNISLGIIPAGTANDLASHYGIPTNVAEACDTILHSNIQSADVIQVNDRFFVTAGGFGFPCEVARIANTIKTGSFGRVCAWILGSHLYTAAFLIALVRRDRRLNSWRIRGKGFSVDMDALWLMADNQPSLGKNFLMSPGAENDDGFFDLCLVKNSLSRMEILSLVLKVTRGEHAGCEGVTMGRYQELFLTTDGPIPFFGDGQVFEASSRFSIRIVPRGLKLIAPRNCHVAPSL